MKDSKVHVSRALPARFVPPSGFDYPLDGLLPSDPRRFCFTPAALMGFPLRSVPLLEGIRSVSGRKDPHTVLPPIYPTPTNRDGAGAGDRSFWASTLRRSPWRARVCLVRHPLDAPLGFRLLGLCAKTFVRISPNVRSHACGHAFRHRPGVPAYRSIPASARPSPAVNRQGLEEQPLQAFCTGRFLNIQTMSIRAMCSPCQPARITANPRGSLDGSIVLPELSGC
jgi:hypothetical protein